MTIEILQRLAVALGIGLLLGVERGWKEREGRPGSRAAGIRTHALIALLGCIWGLISFFGEIVLGFGALAFILGFAAFEWQEAKTSGNVSGTGFVAVVLAFSLGIYAAKGDLLAAASTGVVATIILAEREMLHQFLNKLKWVELRDGLLLLLMSVVLLPLMPDRSIDPWGAVNPFQIWLITILIAATSYGGYIAVRVAGVEKGPLYAGLAGGLVSSTTVTWTFARLARQNMAAGLPLTAGILSSWLVSLLRMFTAATLLAPSLLVPLAGPILMAALVLAIVSGSLYWRGRVRGTKGLLKLEHPFELFAVLRFGLLIVVISLIVEWIKPIFGQYGLFGIAASSGLADVDPVTIAMARVAGTSIDPALAARVILTAALANLVAKTVLGIAFGGWRFAMPLLFTAAGVVAVAASVLP